MYIHNEMVSFIWSVADLIRDSFKRGHYQDIILPFTVLRRIDRVLALTRDDVRRRYPTLRDRQDNFDLQLQQASGYAFYNTSWSIIRANQAFFRIRIRTVVG